MAAIALADLSIRLGGYLGASTKEFPKKVASWRGMALGTIHGMGRWVAELGKGPSLCPMTLRAIGAKAPRMRILLAVTRGAAQQPFFLR